MLNGMATIVASIVGFDKKDIVEMSEYFPKSKSSGRSVKVN